MVSEMERLDKHRGLVPPGPVQPVRPTRGGPGRAALFAHGAGSSSYLWRHVIELHGQRRRVAVDLALYGHTPV